MYMHTVSLQTVYLLSTLQGIMEFHANGEYIPLHVLLCIYMYSACNLKQPVFTSLVPRPSPATRYYKRVTFEPSENLKRERAWYILSRE